MGKQEGEGRPPTGGVAAPADATAAALALGRSSRSKALDAEATAFLCEQRALIEKQSRLLDIEIANLMEDRALEHRHLALRFFGDRLRIGLQVLGIAAGLVVLVGFGALVWRAHEAHGLVVEAFQTPADLAGRGFTGVVAAHLVVDRMNDLVSNADLYSFRAARSIGGDWGNDVKVEIPDTGVSISELERLLRQWFGRQTTVSGEVYSPGQGYVVRLRAGAGPPVQVRGDGADMEQLVTQAGDQLFAETQPYRYAVWLENQNRFDEAEKVFAATAATGPREERAWAYEGWTNLLVRKGDNRAALDKARMALALEPQLVSACDGLPQWALGHWQQSLDDTRACAKALARGVAADYSPAGATFFEAAIPVMIYDNTGDWRGEFAQQQKFLPVEDFEGGGSGMVAVDFAALEARMHDVAASRRRLAAAPESTDGFAMAHFWMNGPYLPHAEGLAALDDWASAITDLEAADRDAQAAGDAEDARRTYLWPLLAYAYQKVGRPADAEAMIARTPPDCDFCIRWRGDIAAARGDWTGAERWFALATRMAPDIPFAFADWGAMRLAKGDVAGAIQALNTAHVKGPHFADPLELWGEALMRRGDFGGAIAKFAEADRDAPRWGRNHMRWGEALARLGRTDQAQAQYRAAASMDLSTQDRAALLALDKGS